MAELGSNIPTDNQLLTTRMLEGGSADSGIFDIAVPPPGTPMRPVERVPRDKFGIVGPFPLTLQDLDALVDRLRDGVQCADGGRSSRQRDVDPLPLECLADFTLADDALTIGEGLLQIAFDGVGHAADEPAFVRAELAHPAHQVG